MAIEAAARGLEEMNASSGQKKRAQRRAPRKGRRGLTLIEILVVVTILGLIAGIVGITVANQLEDAKIDTANVQIGNIADAVDKSTLAGDYPAALSGILSQHGWNLGWIGATTIVGGVFVWRASMTAVWVTALVGGMADVGYFLFIDLPGYARFVPGTIMTVFSGTAVLLTAWVWFSRAKSGARITS